MSANYTIEFIYQDNGQIFQTGAVMTDEEVKRMDRILAQYALAGAVEQENVYQHQPVIQDFDTALGEIMVALEHEVADGDDKSRCQDCQIEWPDAVLINPIKDLTQRVKPGESMPSGECPSCGALCQPIEE